MQSSKYKIIFISIIFLGIFGLAKSSEAATYYVDSVTGDDTRTSIQAQSQGTPWAHMPGMSGCISNCNSYAVQSGDIFILKGGSVWTFASTTADLITIGQSGITIQGGQRLDIPWGTGYPILDGAGTTGSRSGVIMNNKSNIIIDGIEILNTELSPSGGSGIFFYGTTVNFEIKNCYLKNTGDQSIRGVPGNESSHILIYNNISENVGRLFIAVSDSVTVDDIQIYNNIFRGVGNWPGGIVGGVHGDGIMIGSECTASNTCLTNLKIHHNKFYYDWASGATALIFLSNGTGSGHTQYGGNHVQIYNNQLAIDTDGLISPGLIYIWSHWNDVKIYNNTFGAFYSGSNPISSCIAINDSATNIDIKNNIFSGCTSAGVTFGSECDTSLVTLDYNFYSSELVRFINGWNGTSADCRSLSACHSVPFSQEANGKTGDPKFNILPNGTLGHGDWQLQSSSTAINGGADLQSFFDDDLNLVSRPRGSAWDIGAYEYAPASDTTPPAAPSGLSVN
jgi:hypothetical protein